MNYFSQRQNFLQNLCLTFKDFLEKWDTANLEGKKTLEDLNNYFSELRIVTEKKRSSNQVFLNINEEIIQEKSVNIVKSLEQAKLLVGKLKSLSEFFLKQTENLETCLNEVLAKDKECLDPKFSQFTKIVAVSKIISTMLQNEINLKEKIIDDLLVIVLTKDPDYKLFNESKLLLQLWVFSPYIKDDILDDFLNSIVSL